MNETDSTERLLLGRTIRAMRARVGISQEEMGHRGGLHRNYVGAIERGEINPTFTTMLKLARGLGMRLSRLAAAYEAEVDDARG